MTEDKQSAAKCIQLFLRKYKKEKKMFFCKVCYLPRSAELELCEKCIHKSSEDKDLDRQKINPLASKLHLLKIKEEIVDSNYSSLMLKRRALDRERDAIEQLKQARKKQLQIDERKKRLRNKQLLEMNRAREEEQRKLKQLEELDYLQQQNDNLERKIKQAQVAKKKKKAVKVQEGSKSVPIKMIMTSSKNIVDEAKKYNEKLMKQNNPIKKGFISKEYVKASDSKTAVNCYSQDLVPILNGKKPRKIAPTKKKKVYVSDFKKIQSKRKGLVPERSKNQEEVPENGNHRNDDEFYSLYNLHGLKDIKEKLKKITVGKSKQQSLSSSPLVAEIKTSDWCAKLTQEIGLDNINDPATNPSHYSDDKQYFKNEAAIPSQLEHHQDHNLSQLSDYSSNNSCNNNENNREMYQNNQVNSHYQSNTVSTVSTSINQNPLVDKYSVDKVRQLMEKYKIKSTPLSTANESSNRVLSETEVLVQKYSLFPEINNSSSRIEY